MGGPRSRRGPMTRRHPMSASPRRLALHFHLPSYRCVAVRIRCASVGTKRLYSISFRSHHSESSQFRCQSQRVLSVSCHCRHRLASPSRSHALHFLPISLRIATSLIRSLAGLTRGAVSAYVGLAASLGRPPPTRSGPCRCCATGTGRAVRRSRAIRARSPRPWGSSRGC